MDQSLRLPATALVADLGGTNARFAIADLKTLELSHLRQFPCATHPGPGAAIRSYLDEVGTKPTHASLAVAAPVTGEEIVFTNSRWSFTTTTLCRDVGFEKLLVLNDFQALALALPDLRKDELRQIGGAEPGLQDTKIAIGVGTGTGMAALVWSPSGWVAVPSEGGHVSFACHAAQDFALAEILRAGRSHLSVERILSGPGVGDLYRAVAAQRGLKAEELAPNDILTRALARSDALAVETLHLFVQWFGRFAGDAALLFGARGGVYLGGGITPRILQLLRTELFREAFEGKGRMKKYLAPIPVYAVLAEYATLRGAAIAARSDCDGTRSLSNEDASR